MTTTLLPVPPASAPPREAPLAPVAPSRPLSAPETARAVRPVDRGGKVDLVRNPAHDGRPVGPPPAFDVTVLQDILARLARPDALESPDTTDPPSRLNKKV